MADNKKKESDKKLTPEEIYEKAEMLIEADSKIVDKAYRVDNYKTAAKYFKSLGDFKDAPQRAKECQKLADAAKNEYVTACYQEGQELLREAQTSEDYEAARRAFAKTPGYSDADELAKQCSDKKDEIDLKNWKKQRIGLTVFMIIALAAIIVFATPLRGVIFGTSKSAGDEADSSGHDPDSVYALDEAVAGDQVDFGEEKEYRWKVLEKDGDELLLVMFHAEKHEETRNGAYNDALEDVTWADCSLREWLNGEFLDEGFNEEERSKMILQKCENPGNQTYGTDGGEDTEDYVTLLTPEMYEKYYDIVDTIAMNFWLRAPGATQQSAEFASHRKEIMDYGYAVNSDQFYVVPVIRVKAIEE